MTTRKKPVPLRDGDLALTNAFIERKPNGARLVSFDDARRQMRSA